MSPTIARRSAVTVTLLVLLMLACSIPGRPSLMAQEPTRAKSPPPAIGGSRAEQLSLPLRTWVARALPGGSDVPCRNECKHMRLDHNPDDGLIYLMGGDHRGSEPGHYQSGRNEMYTYSIGRDEWRRIQPYCRPDGGPQPNGADEVGWTYDRTRRMFWMVPGFMQGHKDKCPGGQLVRDKMMQYDPAAGQWTVLEAALPGRGGWTTQAFHDPVTDSVIAFRYDGGVGASALIFDVKSSRWTRVALRNIAAARVSDTLPTFDQAGRHIYIIPQRVDQLYRYHVDKRTVDDLGPAPPGGFLNERMPIWDSVNEVLLFPASDPESRAITLHVWDSRSQQWTTDAMKTDPPGGEVRARHAVFDPLQNVLMVMGRDDKIWLYRYGPGRPR